MAEAFAFQAVLVLRSARPDPEKSVVRTIAIRDDQTLEQLHEAFRLSFGWADSNLYSFWLSGKFWDDTGEYTAPYELLLKVVDRWQAGDESYPMLVEAEGVPPPQYAELDEDE